MKTLSILLTSLFAVSFQAQAAWIVEPSHAMACTKDANPWGHSSRCACPEATQYNEKLGKCTRGEKYPILVQGTLRTGLVFIGGETTGFELQTEDGKFELVLSLADQEKLAQKGNGLPFEVSGEFVLRYGVERPLRPTIIVDTINWLD